MAVFLFVYAGIPVGAETIPVAAEESTETESTPIRVREVEGLRETNAETYLMSDGTYECIVYTEKIRMRMVSLERLGFARDVLGKFRTTETTTTKSADRRKHANHSD